MISNVCGNCEHFRLGSGQKFFNCAYAEHSGIKYAKQVRGDTKACDAFSPPKQRPEPPPGRLCNWRRIILIAALFIIIPLLAWIAYTCATSSGQPEPTPIPTPTPTPTVTAKPTPISIPVTPSPPTPESVSYFQIGEWLSSTDTLINITSVERTKLYSTPGPVSAPPEASFIFISLTMLNSSSLPIEVQATDFSLIDSYGISYTAKELGAFFYGAFPFMATTLEPGHTVDGKILFVVPDVSAWLEIRSVVDGHKVGWKLPY